MKTRIVTKCLTAIFCALLFFVGFWLLLGQVDFNGKESQPDFLLPFVVNTSACLLLGWVNCGSFTRALISAMAAMIIGIPVSYLLLAPTADAVLQIVAPDGSLSVSGSFTGIWFFVSPIVLLEILTDRALQPGRWQRFVGGLLISLILLTSGEIFAVRFGETTTLSLIKLAVYAPLLWGIIVLATNYPNQSSNQH